MNCLKFTDMWSTFFFFHAEFIFIVGNFCISCLFCGLHDILLSFARTSSKCQFHAGSTKCSKRNVICSGIYEIDLHVEVKPLVKPLVNLGKQIVLYLSKNKLDDETKQHINDITLYCHNSLPTRIGFLFCLNK